MKATGKAFPLATCILQASVARRLACLKRTPVITLACCSGLNGDLYICGVEAFWTRLKLEAPSSLTEGLEHMSRLTYRWA